MIGPGFTNLDFPLAKTIAAGREGHRVQIRGEFFNLFNHPNFDLPNDTFGASTFGEVLSAKSATTPTPTRGGSSTPGRW